MHTKVSIDTFVQWLRLRTSGLITAVNADLIQINAKEEIDVHRDSSCTSEKPPEFRKSGTCWWRVGSLPKGTAVTKPPTQTNKKQEDS
jgi:hypothetical protein